MLKRFSLRVHNFEFNKKTFQTFNKNLIPSLLGKRGNQTAINTAGSAWKKIINRYRPRPQSYRNPQYNKLLNFLKQHLAKESNVINESFGFIEIDPRKLAQSENESKQKTLASFYRFREIMVRNLRKFKSSRAFRIKVVEQVLTPEFEFKNNIPPEYTYIILCLYIAKTYPLLAHADFTRFLSFVATDTSTFLKKYYAALVRKDKKPIKNLTAFCYTQYFWFDYRLSDSPESAIHSILFGMFEELNISSSISMTIKIGDHEQLEKIIKETIPEARVHFPVKQLIQATKRAKDKVTQPRQPRVFNVAKELNSIRIGKLHKEIVRPGDVSIHPIVKLHAETKLKLHQVHGEEIYLPPDFSVETAKAYIPLIKEFRDLLTKILNLWPSNLTKIAHISIEPNYRDAHHEKGVGIIFNVSIFERTKSLTYWIWTAARELTYARFGRLDDMTLPFMRDLVVMGFEKVGKISD